MQLYWRLALLFGFLPVICSASYARFLTFYGWAPWGSWSQCSTTSGYGVQTRHRNCHSLSACPVGGDESKICVTAVHGGWSSWTTYSCSTSCGGGQVLRLRSCTNPVPVFGGSKCRGQAFEFVSCNTHPCHSSYATTSNFKGWGSWSSWSHCSSTSGIGSQTRHRNCISSHACPVGGDEAKPCLIAVHGGWSSWTTYSCTKSCGGGHALRLRSCTNPVPLFGGSGCHGHISEYAACNTHPCHGSTASTTLPTTTTVTPSTSTTPPTTTNPTTKQSPTTSTAPPTTTTTPPTTTTPATTTTTPTTMTTTTTTTQTTTTKPQITTTKSTPTTTKARFFTIRALMT